MLVMRRKERTQVEEMSKEEVTLILGGDLGHPFFPGVDKRLARSEEAQIIIIIVVVGLKHLSLVLPL